MGGLGFFLGYMSVKKEQKQNEWKDTTSHGERVVWVILNQEKKEKINPNSDHHISQSEHPIENSVLDSVLVEYSLKKTTIYTLKKGIEFGKIGIILIINSLKN